MSLGHIDSSFQICSHMHPASFDAGLRFLGLCVMFRRSSVSSDCYAFIAFKWVSICMLDNHICDSVMCCYHQSLIASKISYHVNPYMSKGETITLLA